MDSVCGCVFVCVCACAGLSGFRGHEWWAEVTSHSSSSWSPSIGQRDGLRLIPPPQSESSSCWANQMQISAKKKKEAFRTPLSSPPMAEKHSGPSSLSIDPFAGENRRVNIYLPTQEDVFALSRVRASEEGAKNICD